MVELFERLGVPGTVISVIAFVLLVAGAIKEFVTSFSTFKKVFNWIKGIKEKLKKKKTKRKKLEKTIASVEALLADINQHYSKDNISKRDEWINWVNGRAETYNSTLENINERLGSLDEKLEKTTNLAEKTRLD
jgi:chromosome segregation ATPase